jgi:hypothetical protein
MFECKEMKTSKIQQVKIVSKEQAQISYNDASEAERMGRIIFAVRNLHNMGIEGTNSIFYNFKVTHQPNDKNIVIEGEISHFISLIKEEKLIDEQQARKLHTELLKLTGEKVSSSSNEGSSSSNEVSSSSKDEEALAKFSLFTKNLPTEIQILMKEALQVSKLKEKEKKDLKIAVEGLITEAEKVKKVLDTFTVSIPRNKNSLHMD